MNINFFYYINSYFNELISSNTFAIISLLISTFLGLLGIYLVISFEIWKPRKIKRKIKNEINYIVEQIIKDFTNIDILNMNLLNEKYKNEKTLPYIINAEENSLLEKLFDLIIKYYDNDIHWKYEYLNTKSVVDDCKNEIRNEWNYIGRIYRILENQFPKNKEFEVLVEENQFFIHFELFCIKLLHEWISKKKISLSEKAKEEILKFLSNENTTLKKICINNIKEKLSNEVDEIKIEHKKEILKYLHKNWKKISLNENYKWEIENILSENKKSKNAIKLEAYKNLIKKKDLLFEIKKIEKLFLKNNLYLKNMQYEDDVINFYAEVINFYDKNLSLKISENLKNKISCCIMKQNFWSIQFKEFDLEKEKNKIIKKLEEEEKYESLPKYLKDYFLKQ